MTSYPLTKVCPTCRNIYNKPYTESVKNWVERHKFCSLKCRSIAQKGKPLSGETKKRMGLARTGEKNHKWKGGTVGYYALHAWVKRRLGSPGTCEECGKSGLSGVYIHWANISGEYKRDLDDWTRLCVWCHMKLDGTSIELNMRRKNRGLTS